MAGHDRRWNWNVHYHSAVLAEVPPGARTALDVGTGDGLLAFDLADRGLEVLAIDLDAASIERATADARASARVTFRVADLFELPVGPAAGRFDVVAAIAVLHHLDAVFALRRMRQLTAPGGVVAVVAFVRPVGPLEVGLAAFGAAYKRLRTLVGRYWEHRAPTVWPPPHTTAQLAAIVADELPGAALRRGFSGRVTIAWHAPVTG